MIDPTTSTPSSQVGYPRTRVRPLFAFQSRLGRQDIPNAVGVDQEGILISALRSLSGTSGLSRNDTPGGFSIDSQVNFHGGNALPNGTYEWRGFLIAPEAGYYTISLQREIPSAKGKTNADYGDTFAIGSISINGTEVAEGYRLLSDGGVRPRSNSIVTRDGWDNIKAFVYLSAGSHEFSAMIVGLLQQPVNVRLCWVTPSQGEANIQEAVTVAKSVKKPILFAFAQSPAQAGMTLDDNMDVLVSRVAAANPNTVLVLNNGEPVMMPWLDAVPAVLEMQYPGQEGSWATVDLLLGTHNPRARLTVTYPTAVNTSVTRNPAYPGRVDTADGNATFSEGLNVGYRCYTSFEYSSLKVEKYSGDRWHGPWSRDVRHWGPGHRTSADDVFNVSFMITNTGAVDGVEVPQVYIGTPAGAAQKYPGVQFAAIALVGFDDVEIAAGESALVDIAIAERELSFYDVSSGGWQLAEGEREVWIGKSAENVVLAGEVTI